MLFSGRYCIVTEIITFWKRHELPPRLAFTRFCSEFATCSLHLICSTLWAPLFKVSVFFLASQRIYHWLSKVKTHLKDTRWLIQNQGQPRRIRLGKRASEAADTKADIIVVRTHWLQCHCFQYCCWTLLDVWYCHCIEGHNCKSLLKLSHHLRYLSICLRLYCLGLIRLSSIYQYLHLLPENFLWIYKKTAQFVPGRLKVLSVSPQPEIDRS